MEVDDIVYRAVDDTLLPTVSTFTIDTYEIHKITNKGIWIRSMPGSPRQWRKVTGRLTDYVQPTQLLALKSYAARKRRQVTIYEHKLFAAKARLREALLCIRDKKVGDMRL